METPKKSKNNVIVKLIKKKTKLILENGLIATVSTNAMSVITKNISLIK